MLVREIGRTWGIQTMLVRVSMGKARQRKRAQGDKQSSSKRGKVRLCLVLTILANGGSHKAVATPIKAIPISSRPAKRGSSPADAQSNGAPVPTPGKIPLPTSLIHATAIACGARVVPPNQAISIVKAIEAKIMSGKAIVANAPVLHKCKPLSGETTREVHDVNESREHD
ncbi:hypothetical protein FCM35_KLT07257 [Carex littledalei]|uniref:Uncharacterized protein n=1 Tax=Carex littledalei TaxID=544730 RepID=A0A833QZ02_9POAL|nr:hypothetical protein FCM35_KLT07257 [Carex littledalei]